MGASGNSSSKQNEVSFQCTYDIKDIINDIQIINDIDDIFPKYINKEIKSKIKILNGNKKEELIFKKKFNKIGINTIDFIIEGKLTNMSYIFKDCKSLIKVEFINIDTSEVINMKYMFDGCESLEYLDLSNIVTSNVYNMYGMFSLCSKLKEIKGIINFDTSNVKYINSMFSFCESLEYIDLSNFNTSNVEYINWMFHACYELKEIKGIGNFKTSKVKNMNGMFYCTSLEYIDLSNFDTSNVEDMGYMFAYCPELKEIKGMNNFNTSKVKYMHSMFEGCTSLEYLDLYAFNSSNVEYMSGMFSGCSKIKEIKGIKNFNTSKVRDMYRMFYECKSLEYLDLSNFDTSNVENMREMFSECSKLKEINGINNFNISKVKNMDGIFKGDIELYYITISNNKIEIDINKLISKRKENLIAVVFTSIDQKIKFAISCYISDIFSTIEEKLFNEFPELKSKNIYYLSGGNIIDKHLTLDQNKIKNSTTIIINYID